MSERLLGSPTITELTTEPQTVLEVRPSIAKSSTNGALHTVSLEAMFEAERLSVETHLHRLNGNGHKKPEIKKPVYKAVDMGIIFTAETLEEQTEREELSNELLWVTKVDVSPSVYIQVKNEYREISPNGRFKDWDFQTYTVYYMTRVGNENRPSVRNNLEADAKGEHKALFYRDQRDTPNEERPKYDELELYKHINLEGA